MFNALPTELVNFLSTLFTIVITAGGAVWALSGQFAKTREMVENKLDKLETTLVSKMEYHERHDDARFTEVKNDIWQIRVENAAKEAIRENVRKPHKLPTD